MNASAREAPPLLPSHDSHPLGPTWAWLKSRFIEAVWLGQRTSEPDCTGLNTRHHLCEPGQVYLRLSFLNCKTRMVAVSIP